MLCTWFISYDTVLLILRCSQRWGWIFLYLQSEMKLLIWYMQLNMLLIIWYMQLNVLHIWDMQPDTRLLIWFTPVLHIYSSNKSIISIADYAAFVYVYELRINELQTRLLILYCTDNAARLFSRSFCLWLSELQTSCLYMPLFWCEQSWCEQADFYELQMKLCFILYCTD